LGGISGLRLESLWSDDGLVYYYDDDYCYCYLLSVFELYPILCYSVWLPESALRNTESGYLCCRDLKIAETGNFFFFSFNFLNEKPAETSLSLDPNLYDWRIAPELEISPLLS
jgi:hypothetical protein